MIREEHAGVVAALTSGLSNCVYYKSRLQDRILNDANLRGLTPKEIKRELINHVCQAGGSVVKQSKETRLENRDHGYKYVVIVPFDDIPPGVYVEIIMHKPDLNPPEVLIVSVHKAGVLNEAVHSKMWYLPRTRRRVGDAAILHNDD